MPIARQILIAAFFLPVLLFGACSGNEPGNINGSTSNQTSNNNSSVEIVPQDDVEELGKIIKLPLLPEDATYIENVLNNAGGAPEVKKLVAVLKFSSENAEQIAVQSEKYKSAVPADVDAEMWFPPELIAKSQETGDEFLKGTAYAAADFLQSPYLDGRLTRINETNYFVLELTTF